MTMPAVIYYDPPKLLDTPKGPAYCDFVIDYDMHQCFYYHCWVRETGEAWTFRNTEVRLHPCETTKVRISDCRPKPAFLKDPVDMSGVDYAMEKLLVRGMMLAEHLPPASPLAEVLKVRTWASDVREAIGLRPAGSAVQASVTPPGVAGAAATSQAAGDPSQPVAGATQRGRGAPRRGGRPRAVPLARGKLPPTEER